MGTDDGYFDHLTGHGGILYRGSVRQMSEQKEGEQQTAITERQALIAFLEKELASDEKGTRRTGDAESSADAGS